mgnify:CR=1 FL=1
MNPEPRNIIICSHSTDNKFGRHNTNVVKLCQVLESSETGNAFTIPAWARTTRSEYSRTSLEKHSVQAFSKTSKMPAAIS